MVKRAWPPAVLAGAALALAACSPRPPADTAATGPTAPPPYEIAMCPEPWRLQACTAKAGEGPSCAFVPAPEAGPGGQPWAWAYDAEGAEVLRFALPVVPGAEGAPGRVRLALDHAPRPIHRIVVCSVDPRLAVVRDRITRVAVGD